MEYITSKDVRQIIGMEEPEPMMFAFTCGVVKFVSSGIKNKIKTSPIRSGLLFVFFFFFILYGVISGRWSTIFLFIASSVISITALSIGFRRYYKALHNGACHITINKYGISLNICASTGQYVRSFTEDWHLVKSVVCYKDFIVVNMEKKVESLDNILLFHQDIPAARRSILAYWRDALIGVKPEEVPDLYTDDEQQQVIKYIEQRFGEIAVMSNCIDSPSSHLKLAVIEPAENHPYYTLCTIGAGAFRMKVNKKMRIENFTPEHVEFLIHLPANWNVYEEGYSDLENFWPQQLLIRCAQNLKENDACRYPNSILDFGGQLYPTTNACAAYFDFPLPDIAFPAYMNLSTGYTVSFLQVIPVSGDEVDFYDNDNDYDACIKHYFGLDVGKMDEKSVEQRQRIYTKKILEHFTRMLVKV